MFINLDEGREGHCIGVKPRESTHTAATLSLAWFRKGESQASAAQQTLGEQACRPVLKISI